MTAPEREALVKRLYQASAAIHLALSPGEGSGEVSALFRQAANMIEALSAPAVTVTEDARNGDYSDDISPEAFETLRKSVEGVNSSRLDRAVETLNNYTVSDRFPRSERDAVLEEAALIVDDSSSYDQAAGNIAAAIRALKSTTPQTGSQE